MKTIKWCKHVIWQPVDFTKPKGRHHWWSVGLITVPPSWKMCPICGAERPTKADVRAATLRFLMDNDQ